MAGAILLFIFSFYLLENISNGNVADFFQDGSILKAFPTNFISLPFPIVVPPTVTETLPVIPPENDTNTSGNFPGNSFGSGGGGNSGNNSSGNNGCGNACPPVLFCGDGVKNGNESCDGSDFGSFGNGVSQCAAYDSVFVSGNLLCDDCVITTTLCLGGNVSDTTPPSIPTGLTGQSISSSSIRFSWNASTDNVGVSGYFVDISTVQNFSSLVGSWNNADVGNVLLVNVTGLTSNTTYFARVRAYDAAGNRSESSAVSSVATSPSGPALSACSNGIDDDADGLVDWQYDLGCSDSLDTSELAESLSNENGWSTFDTSANTTIIYVSSSQGNDSWTGLCPDAPASGLCGPKKNIFAGVNALRNGFPDWLLLRRGDTWNATQEFTSSWSLSGESPSKPMVIASYGLSTQRPHIVTDTGFTISSNGLISNVALLDVHFSRASDSIQDTQGIFLLGGVRSFLIENVLVERYNLNIGTQAWNNLSSQDVSIRRSIIADAFSKSNDHVQGGYFSGVDMLLLEDTLWVHNGWSETIPGATPANFFRRNIYIQSDVTNVIVRGIISAQSSSEGIQLRPGGIMEDSLFLKNSGNFFGCNLSDYDNCGYANPARSGEVRRNVFMESRDISPNDPRGSGLRIEAVDARVYDNIFAHGGSDPATYNVVAIELNNSSSDVDIYNNIVYDWSRPQQLGSTALAVSSNMVAHIYNNTFQMPAQGDALSLKFANPPSLLSFSGNRYFSTSSTPFEYADAHHDYSSWISYSGETGSSLTQVSFPHPERSISTYMSSLGGTPSLDGFLTQARAQSKWNWRDEYSAQAVNEYIREGFGS